MTERQRERELILAPNEFAYVLDTTKGHINCYVGPNKTSLAQTDQPVVFNARTKRFEHVELHVATQLFPTAPANWYLVLKNPSVGGQHPTPGVSNAMAELAVGEKVVLRGPASFPLWPGQMARVVEGHRLETNEYLFVHVYDAERAAEGWSDALGDDDDTLALQVGDVIAIRGTRTRFFIPPDGAEVVPDDDGNHVRRAVTLDALEFCILERDDGTRRYVRGEAVVFPEPEEEFVTRGGARKFGAFELSSTTGIHVKVVAPYTDEDGEHAVGEELFVTGENRIYFPRAEHVTVTYGDQQSEVHHAVAIPRGEGRYVLDRDTGEVNVVLGPRMFLPDPRREVIVRRVLSDRECALLYPGNEEVLRFNRSARGGAPARTPVPEASQPGERARTRSDVIERNWIPPRTLTLDSGLGGVVSVDVWPGYAVQVINRSDERRVEVGPGTVLLDYDETLAAMSLSTGTPKTDARPLQTAFLQVTGNRVSDAFAVTTADMVECWVRLAYRVDFHGPDPSKWFAVDDYVKLVCEHGRSLVGNVCRSVSVRELFAAVTPTIRDAVLGQSDETGERPGRAFGENAMRVYDVEVLEFGVLDDEVADVLLEAQHSAISSAIEVAQQMSDVAEHAQLQELERERHLSLHETAKLKAELAGERAELETNLDRQRAELNAGLARLKRAAELEAATELTKVIERTLACRQMEHDAEVAHRSDEMDLRIRELTARVEAATQHAQAVSPHLVEALQRLGDEQLLGQLSENFSELAAIEGRGLLETARKFLDFVPSAYLPRLGDGE